MYKPINRQTAAQVIQTRWQIGNVRLHSRGINAQKPHGVWARDNNLGLEVIAVQYFGHATYEDNLPNLNGVRSFGPSIWNDRSHCYSRVWQHYAVYKRTQHKPFHHRDRRWRSTQSSNINLQLIVNGGIALSFDNLNCGKRKSSESFKQSMRCSGC